MIGYMMNDWLQKHPTLEQTAVCKYYDKDIRFYRKSDLRSHSKTVTHADNVNAAKKLGTFATNIPTNSIFKEMVDTAKLRTSQYIAEHEDAVESVDDLTRLIQLQALNPDAAIAMRLRRDKCSAIIKNVLYPVEFDKIINILNKSKFIILVNESTDISNTKLLCISIQYFSYSSCKVVQHLLQ